MGFCGEYTLRVVGPDGKEKQRQVIKNLTPKVVRSSVIENMFNATPSSPTLISHFAVGSGTTAPADGDTTLETEVARIALTSRANADDIGTASTVFGAGAATGTHTELGVFFEATGVADSGILGSRTIISITVDALDSLFIDFRLTLSAV